jgi:uncharacterized protein GlcG (DUF336 family)
MAVPSYGVSITLEAAKKVVAAAETEAAKSGWQMTIAILDAGGNLVLLHRMDNANLGSVMLSQQKAKTAVNFRRDTKVYEDLVAQGGIQLRLLAAEGLLPLDGGLPLLIDGKIVGAIGVSGAQSFEDAQVARTGARAL